MEFVSVCGRLDPASGRDSARALIGRLYSGLPRDDTRQVQASTRAIGASVQARRELRFVRSQPASEEGGGRALPWQGTFEDVGAGTAVVRDTGRLLDLDLIQSRRRIGYR